MNEPEAAKNLLLSHDCQSCHYFEVGWKNSTSFTRKYDGCSLLRQWALNGYQWDFEIFTYEVKKIDRLFFYSAGQLLIPEKHYKFENNHIILYHKYGPEIIGRTDIEIIEFLPDNSISRYTALFGIFPLPATNTCEHFM